MADRIELHAMPMVILNEPDLGVVAATFFLPDGDRRSRFKDYLWAERTVIQMLQRRALALRGTDIVHWQLQLNPFAEREGQTGLQIHAWGRVVKR